MKNIFLFFLIFLLFGSLAFLPVEENSLAKIALPFFLVYKEFRIVLGLVNALSIALSTYANTKEQSGRHFPLRYYIALFLNFVLQLATLLIFRGATHLLATFFFTVFTFLSTLILYKETAKVNERSTKYLNFYTLWTLFLTLLSLLTYTLNR